MVKRRRWLVFFGEGCGPAWWKPFLRRGFCHVSAAAYFVEQERWVYVDAGFSGLAVEVHRPSEFEGRLAQLIRDSSVILRVPAAARRTMPPRGWWCVGLVKALLGIHCRALLPYQLYRHLLRDGAEIVEVPVGQLSQAEDRSAAGGPAGDGVSQSGTAARRAGQTSGDAGSACDRDAAAA
jgi:hypothetical protein